MLNTFGLGRILIFLGSILILIGILVSLAGKIPWLGRLPGDILIKKENLTFYFPITTSIILSIIISLILLFIGRRL